MEEKHMEILTRRRVALVKDLVPEKIFAHLIQVGVMTSDDQERINKIDKRRSQSKEFLRTLRARGPRAYEEFVKALEEKQPFLACILPREELKVVEDKSKELENCLKENREEFAAAEAGRREPINQIQENQAALNKSSDKQPRGKRRKSSKRTKNNKRGSLGTLTIKVAATGVTTKKNSPEYNALRERLTRYATQELECFPLTTQQELQQFCYYLRKHLDIELSEKKPGSLILTVHCRTLEILERLWEDYCSGHLDEVAEECFLTDETTKTKEEKGEKGEDDVDTICLETTIPKKDYLRCKKFLTESSGFKSLTDEENVAMENIKYKNILLKFHVLLLQNLDPNDVSLQLLTAGVLTSHDKEKIEEKPSQKEKSEELLMILATKGPRAYEEFVIALEKNQCFLACQLLKEEKENLLFEVRERERLQNAELLLEEKRAITKAQVKRAELLKTRNEPFTTDQILTIQHRYDVGICWRELGIALGIDPGRLDRLTQRYKLDSERAHHVLKMWIDDKGNDATEGRLACALIAIGKREIADKLLGNKSKQPSEWEGEQSSEQLSEQETLDDICSLQPESETSKQPGERETQDDIFSLRAEVQKLGNIVAEQERPQKESEELQKKMIEECKQMNELFQLILNTKTFYQGEQSKQPGEREEEQCEQPSEQETPEDIFSLVAEVTKLRKIVSERERQQMESEELQKKMIEEWKQMKLQFQSEKSKQTSKLEGEQSEQRSERETPGDIFSLRTGALCQGEQSKQPTERKKTEDIFSLLAEVRELRKITTERETPVQQKENEELKEMVTQCKEMNRQVQHLLRTNKI